jgi:acetyl-CoA acyltransferase
LARAISAVVVEERLGVAFVYDAVRTPFGRFGGGLAEVRPDDLAASVLSALLARSDGLDPGDVDEVLFGNANGAGEENRNVARMAVLLAGLPVSVPGATINRLCGSSLDAAMTASRLIDVGDADVVVAGGVESMSRAPWVLPKPAGGYPAGDVTAVSTTLGWRLVNARMPTEWTVSLGEANEILREKLGIARDRQDAFALESHRRADAAWKSGFYDSLVAPVPGTELVRDEGIRSDTSVEQLAALAPVFRPDGTITAGNASPLNDGASAVLIGSERAADRIGRPPTARIAGRAAVATEPQFFGYAPVEAAELAMRRAGISWGDVGAVELNEAFAVQSLACIDAWDVDPAAVNRHGGAIAIGHPLGASGGRILATLAESIRVGRHRWGIAAICIGVGQGLAVVLENAAS